MAHKSKSPAGFKPIGPAHLVAALHATQKRKPGSGKVTTSQK